MGSTQVAQSNNTPLFFALKNENLARFVVGLLLAAAVDKKAVAILTDCNRIRTNCLLTKQQVNASVHSLQRYRKGNQNTDYGTYYY